MTINDQVYVGLHVFSAAGEVLMHYAMLKKVLVLISTFWFLYCSELTDKMTSDYSYYSTVSQSD